MKTYKIKLEFLGKLLAITVKARSKLHAVELIKSRVDIHNIEVMDYEDTSDDLVDFLKQIFNIK